ncbi:MAG: hypothetical protein AAGF97_13645 [Planctomycetota bacterium]
MNARPIITIALITFGVCQVTDAQTGLPRVACGGNGRLIELKPHAQTAYQPAAYHPPVLPYRDVGSYAAAPIPTYPISAPVAPAVPVSSRVIASGGCAPLGYQAAYPNYGGYPSAVPPQYPYWTGNGSFRRAYGDEFVGINLFGSPTRYDRSQPVRNIFRWLSP